jgi:hypothetical protein
MNPLWKTLILKISQLNGKVSFVFLKLENMYSMPKVMMVLKLNSMDKSLFKTDLKVEVLGFLIIKIF